MSSREPSSSPVRAARRLIPAVLALAALPATGCSHKRSAMRPVFVGPSRAVVAEPPCATPGGCDGDGAPAATVIPGGSAITTPGTLSGPAPIPLRPESTPPASGGSEPPLQLNSPGASRSGPELDRPTSTTSVLRPARRMAIGKGRRLQLHRDVQAFVNDPADLFQPPRAERPWRYIVLHHSAHPEGGYAQIDREHRERLGTAGCGYHFVIGNGSESPDGQIEVANRWSEQKGGAHCRDSKDGDANEYGIGICLVGDLEKNPPTPKQIEAAHALVAYLQDRYTIAPQNVATHAHVAQTATPCPGKHFPVRTVLGDLGLANN